MAMLIPPSLCNKLVNVLATELTSLDPSVLVSLPTAPKFYLSPRSGILEFSGLQRVGTWTGKKGKVEGKKDDSSYSFSLSTGIPDSLFRTTPDNNWSGPRKAWKGKIIEYVHDLDLLTLSLLSSNLKDPESKMGFSLWIKAGEVIHVIGKENFSLWNYYLWSTQGGETGGRNGVFLIEEGKQRVRIYSPLYTSLIPIHRIVNTGEGPAGEKNVILQENVELVSLAREYKNWKDLWLERVEGIAFQKLSEIAPWIVVKRKSIRFDETWPSGGGMQGSMRTYEPMIENIIYVRKNLSDIPSESSEE